PVVLGFMNEFVSHQPHANENCYGFRLEGTFLSLRTAGSTNFGPHGGGGLFNLPGNSHVYRCYPGRAHSGLTRVVWELNPVEKGDGGTTATTLATTPSAASGTSGSRTPRSSASCPSNGRRSSGPSTVRTTSSPKRRADDAA